MHGSESKGVEFLLKGGGVVGIVVGGLGETSDDGVGMGVFFFEYSDSEATEWLGVEAGVSEDEVFCVCGCP